MQDTGEALPLSSYQVWESLEVQLLPNLGWLTSLNVKEGRVRRESASASCCSALQLLEGLPPSYPHLSMVRRGPKRIRL